MSATTIERPAAQTGRAGRARAAYEALHVVIDPELDEPITDLGFVRSVDVDGDRVEVHLRLPTSFCSPNFAYLMASDAKDALVALPWTGDVVVELDDHHDSEVINAGLRQRCRLGGHVRQRGRGEPGRPARDVPAQGPHRRHGALPHRGAAPGPDHDGDRPGRRRPR